MAWVLRYGFYHRQRWIPYLLFSSHHHRTRHIHTIQPLLCINSQPPRPHHSRLRLAAVWATFGTRLLSRITCG
ncbi:hypothetical protein CKAH01_16628 [Colletotrichum kahawae]|uniref:Uncharacterized protein n=1 Tax=Colletotrichum kahawae TaxID=34407 RepID=A0AAD9YG35_COLKA|nr:hypothetical protein CKAH01_16628 [Colletotrichum kahawae]